MTAWADIEQQRQAELTECERNAKRIDDAPWPGATSWSFSEREKWGDGPWAGEPDKVLWRDKATGLPCIARRGHMGSWCGYVGVDAGHPMHGKAYDDVHKALPDLEVHGGLTYAEPCDEAGGLLAVCHQTDGDDHVWWLGFDCAHCDDFTRMYEIEALKLKGLNGAERSTRRSICSRSYADLMAEAERSYKNLGWVRLETEDLARQLKAVRR